MMTTLQNDQWWLDTLKWVDAGDIEKMGIGVLQTLRDLVVSRPTEYGRFVSLFRKSLKRKVKLTTRQQEAWVLAQEADLKGITRTRYISDQLGIHRQSAWELLKRAEDRLIVIEFQKDQKILTYGVSVPIYGDSGRKIQLPAREVKQRREKIVVCPTKAYNDHCAGVASSRFGICHSCSEIWGKTQADRPPWVQFLIRDNERMRYADAKDRLFDEKYGIDDDISELM